MADKQIRKRSPLVLFASSEQLMWFSYVLIVLVFCIAAALLLVNRYQSRFNLARDYLNNLALVHDENLLLQMSYIESIARATVDDVRINIHDTEKLQDYVDSVAQQLPQLRTIVVVDSSGIIIADSRPDRPAIGIDVGDRDYFRVHTENQTKQLFIDNPIMSRADQTWSLPITLGVWNDEGGFLGIVIASLEPTYFSNSIGNFVEDGIAGYITKEDGTILTSLPYQTEQIGLEIAYHHDEHLVDLAVPDVEITRDKNLIVYRHIAPYDLQIVFVQAQSSIINSFINEVLVVVAIILLLSISTFLVFYWQMKQTQQVQHSENKLRTLTDNISDFVVRFNRDLQHLYVNTSLLESTGLSLEQYLGKTNEELGMPKDQVATWDKHIKQVFKTKTSHDFEFQYKDITGDMRWFHAKLTPEFDHSHEVQAVLSVVRDVTNLKQVELSLETQYRYQSTISELGFAALQTNDLQEFMNIFVESVQKSLDVEYCKVLELQAGQNTLLLRAGVGWQDGIVGQTVVAADRDTLAEYTLNTRFAVVVNNVAEDTRFKWSELLIRHNILSGISIMIPSSEQPYGVLGVHSTQIREFSDNDVKFLESLAALLSAVIERHRAEIEASRERNLLRLLIDNIPDYIFVKDTNKRIIEANLAYAQLAGLPRESVVNKTTAELFPPQIARLHQTDDELILEQGQLIVNEEREVIDFQGNRRWGLVTKLPLKDSDNHITGLVGIARDITDRLEAEAKRMEAERTRIELEEQHKAIALKERFIATASHEFRTPLTVIHSSTELLERYLDRYTPEQRMSKLNGIQDQVYHMISLLDDVLTISKSHANKVTLSLTRIELKQFCYDIWAKAVTVDGGKHFKDFSYMASVDYFVGDPNLLRQSFDNVLSNAMKYTPEGKQIQFAVSNNNDCLIFSVSDQGCGIPEADIHHLFEPFHRARNVNTIAGTGLGLTIVKDFVELHNGSIEIDTQEGEGTTFTIKIPILPDRDYNQG